MDRQPVTVIIDKAEIPELVHEMTNPRPGRSDHLCQVLLIYSGKYRLGSTLFAIMSKHQEYPSQTLFARVEQLVDKILFVPDFA